MPTMIAFDASISRVYSAISGLKTGHGATSTSAGAPAAPARSAAIARAVAGAAHGSGSRTATSWMRPAPRARSPCSEASGRIA